MINLKNDSKIYMVCPSFNKTGGTELAHQLVYQLLKIKLYAFIVYYTENDEKPEINPAFKKYVDNFLTLEEIEDSPSNILIVPEIKPDILNHFNKLQKVIWWMSVDNFEKRNGFKGACKFYGFFNAIKYIIKGNIQLRTFKINKSVNHFYQSEYAKQYLLKKNYTNIYKLSDYLNSSYFTNNENEHIDKKNNVLYNPKKGFDFTKKIIEKSPDLHWVPIQNMTTEQVKSLLNESKVYIDFGNHPGKDRFPREAAISGCCVITGKRGSAKYFQDIPIPEKYKFNDSTKNIDSIIKQVRQCLDNYDDCIGDFKEYKEKISNEYSNFIDDINKIFKQGDEE